jgi:hypothetical protein
MQGGKANLKYIKIFLLVVFIAAVVSLSYKIFLTVKNSAFRYSTFNLLLLSNKEDYIIRINKDQKKLLIVKFPRNDELQNAKRGLARSLIAGIPVDGVGVYKNAGSDVNLNKFMSGGIFLSDFLGSGGVKFTNVNKIDLIKIFLTTKGISKNDREEESTDSLEEAKKVLTSKKGFSDQDIFNEKKSVQIINSTEVNGLGGELAAVLEDLGYNVVSIDSGNDSTSAIYSSDGTSAPIKRLKILLGIPVINSGAGTPIADIKIVVGKNFEKQSAQ